MDEYNIELITIDVAMVISQDTPQFYVSDLREASEPTLLLDRAVP